MALPDRLFVPFLCSFLQRVGLLGQLCSADHFRSGLQRMYKNLIVPEIPVFQIPRSRFRLSGSFAGILQQKLLIKIRVVLTVHEA